MILCIKGFIDTVIDERDFMYDSIEHLLNKVGIFDIRLF